MIMARRRLVAGAAVVLGTLFATRSANHADIYRWDTGAVIPGTEGIEPGPGVQLDDWNTTEHNLRYADFSGGLNLRDAKFNSSWLNEADFSGANLTRAGLWGATLTGATLTGANLTIAGLGRATLSDANLAGANLSQASVWRATLTGADLTDANLTGADLYDSTLAHADLTGAVIKRAQLSFTTDQGFTKGQLYLTASYRAKELQGIYLGGNDLTGWDFSGQDLTNAYLGRTTLTEADLTEATVTQAHFGETTSRGFTKEQLYLTASYQAKKLQGIDLGYNDLTGWDFSEQDLTKADLGDSILTDVNLSGANLTNADLRLSTLTNTDLSGANLKNTDLRVAAGLESVIFDSTTVYSQWTRFPDEFDPETAGLTLSVSARGDFDANGVLDATDVDILTTKMRRRFVSWLPWLDRMLDLDNNGRVEREDQRIWVKDLMHTWYGDANLDGEFNSRDFVQVFLVGEYETDRYASWCNGDWNGDGVSDSGDMVTAFVDGGYEKGPRRDAVVVPEPIGWLLSWLGLAGLLIMRRRL
jgi:uncharacterized protein YjbI with pentapeptide repeats